MPFHGAVILLLLFLNLITFCCACKQIKWLTVSHLAFIFSFSNLANSLLSWMIVSSFQMSSRAKPIKTMPATTPHTMGMISGPAGQSETQHWRVNRNTSRTLSVGGRYSYLRVILQSNCQKVWNEHCSPPTPHKTQQSHPSGCSASSSPGISTTWTSFSVLLLTA